MRVVLVGLLAAIVACGGRREAPPPARGEERLQIVGDAGPPVQSRLADFRPRVAAPADTGGRCREYGYATHRGLRGITWRQEWRAGGFWLIHITLDSAGLPQRYYEDRYSPDPRTLIHLDFPSGAGSAENNSAGLPRETATDRVDAVYHAANLDDPAARIARLLDYCRASLDPWGALARLADSLTPPATPRPSPRVPQLDRTVGLGGSRGMAYLESRDGSYEGITWLRMALLPLYPGPDKSPDAWLARGWIVRPLRPEAQWTPLTAAGWVRHSYEIASLVVLERHDDGWFRFRYAAPDSMGDGTAWAHESHLNLGEIDLRIVGWEEHFLKRVRRTYFTTPGLHMVRGEPSDDSPALDSLPPRDSVTGKLDYSLTAIEVRGSWMKVTVDRPALYCGATAERSFQGWIRWRDSVQASMLQPYSTC